LTNWTEIVNGCKRGEQRAHSEAYRQSWKIIFPAVHRLIRDKAEAEDVMQEAVIKGFDRLGELKDAEKYIGWQKQICLRAALNKLRTQKSIPSLFPEIMESDESEENEIPEMDLVAVQKHLNQLPDGYRIVIKMHLLEEIPHEEIGNALGITASTSRSQYSRALNKLRKEIISEYEKQF